MQIYYKTLL